MIRSFGSTTMPPIDARRIDDLARDHGSMLEALVAGKISATSRSTAAPTSGAWSAGDFVRNAAPAEAGSSPNKYVVFGWICTVGGTPGTWLPCRALTGN
jgi:hypothetical protein